MKQALKTKNIKCKIKIFVYVKGENIIKLTSLCQMLKKICLKTLKSAIRLIKLSYHNGYKTQTRFIQNCYDSGVVTKQGITLYPQY